MPKSLISVADVFALWPSSIEMAKYVNQSGAVVRAWKMRNRIPPTHWEAVIAAANRCGFPAITYAQLADLHRA